MSIVKVTLASAASVMSEALMDRTGTSLELMVTKALGTLIVAPKGLNIVRAKSSASNSASWSSKVCTLTVSDVAPGVKLSLPLTGS